MVVVICCRKRRKRHLRTTELARAWSLSALILLWADSSLEAVSPAVASKPLSVFYSKGDVSARTGWGKSDCLITFNCGPRYSSIWNHADAGSVTLAAQGDVFITDLGHGTIATSERSRHDTIMWC